ncbi:hypothetical protein [Flavobacterium limi]|uniref:Lipoprotein n=1 Tax=Flavobacterium limi TaxID=2045105 RepID=A0ABQ1TM52_9FLAO|nr:hypothetical protein [Flavobacterium limi]GGE98255.1 hypothetical protein GCM10011518_04600 [Flavobacterium limi]
MRKIIFAVLSLIFIACSSDDSKSSVENPSINFVEFKGKKYALEGATINRTPNNYDATEFGITFKNKKTSHAFQIGIRIGTSYNSCPSCPADDIKSGQYTYKEASNLEYVALTEINNNTTITILSTADLTGSANPSRVNITKNPNGTFSFSFNIVSSAGNLTGQYIGTLEKTNF